MSVIYRYKDQLLVSKDYIDFVINKLNGLESLDIVEEVPIDLEPTEVKAEIIIQDPKHRMVTDNQIELWRSKPTLHEVDSHIADAKAALETFINDTYYRLLNIPNTVNRIKKLARILENEEVLANLFKLLDDTVSVDDLKAHEEDTVKHVSNVDRKSLNLLQKVIDSGILEKFEKFDPNQQASSARNSETFAGKTLEDVLAISRPDEFIIGRDFYCTKDNCDLLITGINHAHPTLKIDNYYRYTFTPGRFIFKDIDLSEVKTDTLLQGCAENTVLVFKGDISLHHLIFRDFKIESSEEDKLSTLNIREYTKFDNVIFKDIDIYINGNLNYFINCRFINCKFHFKSGVNSFIMTNNVFDRCDPPKFLGQSIIINNNITLL